MSFGRQRGRWGNINFQSASDSSSSGRPGESHGSESTKPKSYDPPPAKLPGKGPYNNPLALVPTHITASNMTRNTYCSFGKRRAKDEDDYFNDDDEGEELQYLPAPGSPTRERRSGQAVVNNQDDSDEDPLDAFMSEINNEVRTLYETKAKAPKEELGKKTSKRGIRDDIEQEDEMEAYLRFMEENPNVGMDGDEDEQFEYDADGNIIGHEKKMIDPLPPIDHAEIPYNAFEKNFYHEHADIAELTSTQVNDLRAKLGIRVSGVMPCKPVCAFAHIAFDDKLVELIRKSGYTTPTPIQAQAVPIGLSGRDLIGIAKTGSGKTAAYLWPLLTHILDQPELQPGDGPIGLICAPTRELAQQIYTEARKFSKIYNMQVVCAYGGGSMWEQQKACEAGCEILVCTPGRLIDLVRKKSTNLSRVTYLVFDEADKMFNMGFEPQVRSIANHIRPDRQTLLFSATFKKRVERLARDILTDPIRIVQGELGEANEDVTQMVEVFNKLEEKWDWMLRNLVQFTTCGSVLIFVTRKLDCEEVGQRLRTNDFKLGVIHGDIHQSERNNVIHAFKKSEFPILVATDVAARGLDIPSIRTVINFDVARDIDTHTHRVGRTGRAGQKGNAFTLVSREKDKEFSAHLVRNLEAANQFVPPVLLDLANQNPWFKKTRFKTGSGKKMSSFQARSRPGLGAESHSSSGGQISTLPTVAEARSGNNGGPQTDRVAVMKQAFTAQYSRMFVSAGVEGSRYTHPELLGGQHQPTTEPPAQTQPDSDKKRKRSRWD